MTKFKVGDRVKVTKGRRDGENFVGGVGTIIAIYKHALLPCVISFDNWTEATAKRYATIYSEDELELIETPANKRPKAIIYDLDDTQESKIELVKLIYTGRKTILLYKDHPEDKKVHKAIAKCNPDDVYYPFIGQQIALKRAQISKLERELKGLTK